MPTYEEIQETLRAVFTEYWNSCDHDDEWDTGNLADLAMYGAEAVDALLKKAR